MRHRIVALAILLAAITPALGQMRVEPVRPEPYRQPYNPGPNFNNPQPFNNNNPNFKLQSPTVNGPTSQGGQTGSQATSDDRPPMDRAADELDTIDINSLPCIKKIGRVL